MSVSKVLCPPLSRAMGLPLCRYLWQGHGWLSCRPGPPLLKSRSLEVPLKIPWSCSSFCYIKGLSILPLSRSSARNCPMSFKYWTLYKCSPALINGAPISQVKWLQPREEERQPLLAEELYLTASVLLWPRMGKTKTKPSYNVKYTNVGEEYCTWVSADNMPE